MSLVVIIFILLVLGGLATALVLFLRSKQEEAAERWHANRQTVLLKMLVPKNNEKTPLAAENFFAALHGIFRPEEKFQEHISFEIAAREKQIEFFVHCPVDLRDFVEGQIYAQYPSVEIQEITDYARADLANTKIAATELDLARSEYFPIKTFVNFQVDPLSAITGVLANTGEQEQIWIQTLVRPISDTWQSKAVSYASSVRTGTSERSGFIGLVMRAFVDVLRTSSAEGAKAPSPAKLPSGEEQALKALDEKATKLGFSTKIRIVVLAKDPTTATAKLNAVTGVYKQFATPNINSFTVGKVVQDPSVVEAYRDRSFRDKGNIFNIEELASVFHLPNVSVETPNIVWAGSKKGQPPANVPLEDQVPPDELTVYGLTDFRGQKHKFGIKTVDRRQHMYAIGKSGTGKSTLLENMAIDDIRKGRGVAIVDPHGEFVNHVLDFIPDNRIDDVIYFNPADKDNPVGFNLLENVDPSLKNIVASGVVGIFKKLFADSWGPRLEYILRNVVLALLDYPDATLLGIMRLLVDKGFRAKVLTYVKDPVIRDFFINEYEKYDPKFRTEAIAPIQNKVGQFLSASTIRNILGQAKSTFDVEEAMNSRKILILDLSIGKIGEDAAALLGSMMITKIQLASMRRTNIAENERIDFYLYVDEFQNFATDSFAVILSEARKYRLDLILTNQYIAQMPETVVKAIFGNIGTLISFRVGASDAVALVKEFEPVFEANDLVNLDNHHVYVKMSIDGVTRPAFSAVTLAPGNDKSNNRERIIHASRERYSRPREEVEQAMIEASGDTGQMPTPRPSGEQGSGVSQPASQSIVTTTAADQGVQILKDKAGHEWYAAPKISEPLPSPAPTPPVVGESTPIVPAQPLEEKKAIPLSQRILGGSASEDVPSVPDLEPKAEPANEPLPEPPPTEEVVGEKPVKNDDATKIGEPATLQPDPKQGNDVKPLEPDETIVIRD